MDEKQTKTFKLSPSALTLMEDCPRCFWLHLTQNPNQRHSKFYKSIILHLIRMLPSNPMGSLDDFELQQKAYKSKEIRYNIQVPGMALRGNAGLPIHSLNIIGGKI